MYCKMTDKQILNDLIKSNPDKSYQTFNFIYQIPDISKNKLILDVKYSSKLCEIQYTEDLIKLVDNLTELTKKVDSDEYQKFVYAINADESNIITNNISMNKLYELQHKFEAYTMFSTTTPLFKIYNNYNKKKIRTITLFNKIYKQNIYSLEQYRENNIGLNLDDEYVMCDFSEVYKPEEENYFKSGFERKLSLKPYKRITFDKTLCNKPTINDIINQGKFDVVEGSFDVHNVNNPILTKWKETHSLISILYMLNNILNKDGIFIYRLRGFFFSVTRDIFFLLSQLFEDVKFMNVQPSFVMINNSFIVCSKFRLPNKDTQNILEELYNIYSDKYSDCGTNNIDIETSKLSEQIGGTRRSNRTKKIGKSDNIITSLFDIPEKILKDYDKLLNNITYDMLKSIYDYREEKYKELANYKNNKSIIDDLIIQHKSKLMYFIKICGLQPNAAVTYNKSDLDDLINKKFKSSCYDIPLKDSKWKEIVTKDKSVNGIINSIKDLGKDLFIAKRELDVVNLDRYYEVDEKSRPSGFIKKNIKKMYNFSISQAFNKMLEILYDYPLVTTKEVNVFHLCESPGQFILSFDSYCNAKNIKYSWNAQSLNYKNKIVQDKYPGALNDIYHLTKNFPDNWLYGKKVNGEEGTGDITEIDNIIEYSKIKYDIVTSDCGLSVSGDDYGKQEEVMNYINFSQFYTAILCLKMGGGLSKR